MQKDSNVKICIVSNSHPTNDVRLYYKIAKSLAKIGEVYLISTAGLTNKDQNPRQCVVSSESKWVALYQLYLKASKIRPDVVICVEPLTLFVGFALRRFQRTKIVFDVHEFFADAYAERFTPVLRYLAYRSYLSAERWLARRVDYVFGVNHLILKQLTGSKPWSNAHVLPNYPVKNVWDYNCEIPHSIHPICEMEFDLIYIGGLTVDRGIFVILESIALLRKVHPYVKVLIVGRFHNEDVEKTFYAKINTLNLNSVLYYQAWLPAEKIGVLLKRAKLGLWIFNPANKRMANALPLKVLEYLSAGLPLITIKTEIMNALIKANHLGICTDYQPQKLATAIASLLELSEPDYDVMSRACSHIVEEKYNWEAMEPELLRIIQTLAPGK
ncbi:MAG: hypothetical protein CVU48_03720 [Candidatus Cloacimonetes bacterium HGW-Cloacimonetes-1]|jgi:glycosyltransferase involved in cell wall biosynthesis|nr:MAG: hypothetical protein CVU48_03720 [Candidatus Cloacimonetes bacterium HGW-Cloacimonetes-1]